jgi:heme-degrading monooxygenase HmoA
MFARNVLVHLKPNALTEFTNTLNTGVLPLLRKQPGFRDEIVFNGENRVTAISLWDSKEAAAGYETNAYPQVVKMLESFIEGTPKVRLSDVIHSTLPAVKSAAAASNGAPAVSASAPVGTPAAAKIA